MISQDAISYIAPTFSNYFTQALISPLSLYMVTPALFEALYLVPLGEIGFNVCLRSLAYYASLLPVNVY